jgi:hypothetical protein
VGFDVIERPRLGRGSECMVRGFDDSLAKDFYGDATDYRTYTESDFHAEHEDALLGHEVVSEKRVDCEDLRHGDALYDLSCPALAR